jgi:hypothetical protein
MRVLQCAHERLARAHEHGRVGAADLKTARGACSGSSFSSKEVAQDRSGDMGLARPIAAELRDSVVDVGDPPVIEDVTIGRGQFGRTREILRWNERDRKGGHNAHEGKGGIAAFRAYSPLQGGRGTVAAEFNGLIVRQANRVGPEIRSVRERLSVDLLADRAVAIEASDRLSRDGEARRAAVASAILVHRILQPVLTPSPAAVQTPDRGLLASPRCPRGRR